MTDDDLPILEDQIKNLRVIPEDESKWAKSLRNQLLRDARASRDELVLQSTQAEDPADSQAVK